MPKIKRTSQDLANLRFMQAVKGSAAFYQTGSDEIATIAGVSRATWYRRLQHPGEITLDEFRRLCRKFHWDEKTVLDIMRI